MKLLLLTQNHEYLILQISLNVKIFLIYFSILLLLYNFRYTWDVVTKMATVTVKAGRSYRMETSTRVATAVVCEVEKVYMSLKMDVATKVNGGGL